MIQKSYVPTVPMIMSFKILKYFSSCDINFFLFASLCYFKSMGVISKVLIHSNSGLNKKRVFIPRKNVGSWLEFTLR